MREVIWVPKEVRTGYYSEIGGKDENLVKNDCIDLGIGELEKEISRLTQN